MDGKILQLNEVEVKKYINNITYLQKTLLPEMSQMIKALNSIELNNNSVELKKLIQNQNKSLEFSKENSNQIENLTHTIRAIQDSIKTNKSNSNDEHNYNTELQGNIEKSKLQLNQAVRSLNEISIVIQKNAGEINSIKPNVNISEIQTIIDKTIKDAIDFNELDDVLDQYTGKLSYFTEKTGEYDRSILMLDNIIKRIKLIVPATALAIGFSLGVLLTLFLKN